MAMKGQYEPAPRLIHSSFSSQERLYVWGGQIETCSEDELIKLGRCIEEFDPCHEVWRQLNTTGTPHPGLMSAACASAGENVYMYGGYSGERVGGILSKLNLKTLTWSQLSPETVGAPMRKEGCGLITVHDNLVLMGGYGYPTGPIQPHATFISATDSTDGKGWSNEVHLFNMRQGLWSSPIVRWDRPPPCSHFTLTSIDHHRAILFGGIQPRRNMVNDLYIIDFNMMECTKMEPSEGEPWPVERFNHAACCIGYAGDHIHLLVSGGLGREGKSLKDMWLFDHSLKKWTEVSLPDGTLPRWAHSVTTITLCPSLVNVVIFGGSSGDFGFSVRKQARISETTVITFVQKGAEWVLVGVVNSRKIGSADGIKEKIISITTQLQESLSISQDRERTLQRRVEMVEAEIWERERRAMQRVREVEQQLVERERAAEVRIQQLQQDLERRLREVEQHHIERERALEVALRVQQNFERTTWRPREVEEHLTQSERWARQADAPLQQNQQDPHWLVHRREIELTELEVGRGGWAAVKVAYFRGTKVAAKCFYQQIMVSRYNRQLFIREINMAARLRHPNLVQFIGASLEREPIFLTELLTTSLRSELERGPIDHAHITSISLDVARALNYLHLTQPDPIIHRDVTSANVLLDPLPDNCWKAKLSDYGSVNLARELRTVGPGSPSYAAPEANIPAHQSTKMDIFSFGVLLVEMLTDEFPQVYALQRLIDTIYHTGYVELIRRCLREERDDRPSANEIIAIVTDM